MNGREIIVHIFGHSLDETDKEKLLPIFNKANKVKIYCMNVKDFENKAVKVIKLLGKKRAIEEIHSNKIKFVEINSNLYDENEESEEERDIISDKMRPRLVQ